MDAELKGLRVFFMLLKSLWKILEEFVIKWKIFANFATKA